MDILIQLLHKALSSVGPFFLLLGLLIFVHEMGHFLVAIFFGVRVETFSLGFGKKLFTVKRGDTNYCLSLIPMGGYVKMYGDDPTVTIPVDQQPYSFLHKPVGSRIAIVVAGPLMNLIFAIFIFGAIAMLGEEMPGTKIGDITTDTVAYSDGFRSGDTVLKVDGAPVTQWKEVKDLIEDNPTKTLHFTVQREASGKTEEVVATPALKRNEFLFSTNRQVGKIEGLTLDAVSTMLGVPNPQSVAAKSGLQTLDIIEAIDGKTVSYWRDVERAFADSVGSDKKVWTLTVRAFSEKTEHLTDTPTREIKLDRAALANQLEPIAPAEPKLDLKSDSQPSSLLSRFGLVRSDLFLISVNPNSPAARVGMAAGDEVTKINGVNIVTWQDVLDKVKSFQPEQKQISLTVVHGGIQRDVNVTPELFELPTDQGAMEKRFAIGVRPAILMAPQSVYLQKFSNPFVAFSYGIAQSYEWTKLIAISFLRLIQNEVSAKNIGGVITIGRVASKSFEVGLVSFLKMMAVISINLFILNLLPIPVLDGGHLLFFTIEAIKGAPISFRKMEIAQQVGLVLLLSLMIFALFNDITHLISSW